MLRENGQKLLLEMVGQKHLHFISSTLDRVRYELMTLVAA